MLGQRLITGFRRPETLRDPFNPITAAKPQPQRHLKIRWASGAEEGMDHRNLPLGVGGYGEERKIGLAVIPVLL